MSILSVNSTTEASREKRGVFEDKLKGHPRGFCGPRSGNESQAKDHQLRVFYCKSKRPRRQNPL